MPRFEQVQQERNRERREFRDWKKQYVRAFGWLPVFEECKKHYGEVHYLTLCAKEAIDVRYFAQKGVLPRNAEKNDYPSLTFVESDGEDYAFIAESLGKVRLSINGTLEEVLLRKEHAAHQDLIDSFPYHVINLDFCGHIVPPKDHPYSETIKCIDRVVDLQASKDLDHWYLFLTFRAQGEHANQEANQQLEEIVADNLKREDFKASYGKRAAPADLRQRLYPEFLRVGVGKLLADRARAKGLRASMGSSWIYERVAKYEGSDETFKYHIVKLVLRFDRIQKPTELPSPRQSSAAYEQAVHELFKSHATSVDGVSKSARDRVTKELEGVIAEIDEDGITT
jgi:hypothetical protein